MGASHSNPNEHQISQASVLDSVTRDLHSWTSEFGREFAFVYRWTDTGSRICVSCYRECEEKVIYTFYDTVSEDNLVAVNIELVAERVGGDGPYKLGDVKVKEFGENFTVRRRESVGPELLFMRYVMGRSKNQLSLVRLGGDEYKISYSCDRSLIGHSLHICCDPSRGLVVDTEHPQSWIDNFDTLLHRSYKISHNPLDYVFHFHNKPPDGVLKVVNDIRRLWMTEVVSTTFSCANNTSRPSLSYSQHDDIWNEGQNQGLLNGANLRNCQIHIRGTRLQFKGSQNS